MGQVLALGVEHRARDDTLVVRRGVEDLKLSGVADEHAAQAMQAAQFRYLSRCHDQQVRRRQIGHQTSNNSLTIC